VPRLKVYPDAGRIIELYSSGETPRWIAAFFNVSETLVRNSLKKSGVTLRTVSQAQIKYKHNPNSFDLLSPIVNYWLGFFFADGNVHMRTDSPVVSLTLKESDILHVERFRAFIGSEHPIRMRSKTKSCRLDVRSHALAMALARWGIHPRKSTSDIIPSDILLGDRHFWRGVIDGDGCISVKYRVVTLCGTKETCLAFREFVAGQCGILRNVYKASTRNKNSNHWQIRFNGKNALVVGAILYGDTDLYLERKWLKYQDLRMAIENPRPRKRRTRKRSSALVTT
jgi:hypothetical protein